MVPSWREKNISCNPKLLASKDIRPLPLFLNFILFFHNQTHHQLFQVQWVSDSGKRFITFSTSNDFHLGVYCFKFMKPTLLICTFIFSIFPSFLEKRDKTLKELHKGTLLCRQKGMLWPKLDWWQGARPPAPAERIMCQLTWRADV